MPAPSPIPTYIYKILHQLPPSPLPDALPLSPLDAKDGFIHLSTASQVPKTAELIFSDINILWLLKIPLKHIEANIKWEETKSGYFPHLYEERLGGDTVLDVKEVKREGDESWGTTMSREQWLV